MAKLVVFRPSWIPKRLPPRQDQHQAERKARHLPSVNFYQSKAWRDLRALKLSRDPLCERCERNGVSQIAEVVHHVKPVETSPELALDVDNTESVCKRCHNRAHPEKGKR